MPTDIHFYKDEEERGVGRVLLANLESIKTEASRALGSLAAGSQQITSSVTNLTAGLPASNDTLASAGQLPAQSGQSVASNNGGAAVDVRFIVTSPSMLSTLFINVII